MSGICLKMHSWGLVEEFQEITLRLLEEFSLMLK